MRRGAKFIISLVGLLAFTLGVRAVVNDSATDSSSSNETPYNAIWLRNVFDLKPMPPAVADQPKTNTPPPNVELTGITTILGGKRALFMVKKPPEPGKPPGKEESYMLSEGQRQDMLEVLEINTKASTVKIRVADVVSTITFETNRVSSGPQNVANAGAGARPPGFNPPGFSPPNSGGIPLPGRSMRTTDGRGGSNPYSPMASQGGGYQGGGYAPQNVGYAQPGYQGGMQSGGFAAQPVSAGTTPNASVPNGLFNQTPVQSNPGAPQPQVPAMDPAEQAILMEASRQVHANDPTYPPLPPIPGLSNPPQPPSGSGNNNNNNSSGNTGYTGGRSTGSLAK